MHLCTHNGRELISDIPTYTRKRTLEDRKVTRSILIKLLKFDFFNLKSFQYSFLSINKVTFF